MFGQRIELFTLFGFKVGIDTSWVFLAVLVTWSLATGWFPGWYPRLPQLTYWIMGAAGAAGLFVSIVLHELAHSLVARRHGVVMRGITLFIFGGVAEMTSEPPSARGEFQVAVAGPIASVLIAVASFLFVAVGTAAGLSDAVVGVARYLGFINSALVIFNLVPAFPLDGGRVLRSILWHWKKNLIWATWVTSRIGVGFSLLLIGYGVWVAFSEQNLIAGVWYVLIGVFLKGAANMSYQQLALRRSLEGQTVRRFMKNDPVTVNPDISIETLVENYVFKYQYKMFPVVDRDTLLGCVRTREIKDLPKHQWGKFTVRDVSIACSDENSIHPDVDALSALTRMKQSGQSRLMVVENSRLVGVITLKDLLQYLSLKVELSES
ncbi:MAG: site-2 protease family protein [Candidatus Latescibacterota bacterium]|nr:MAG: site-2 protease family protein [Candidatus Latescibacterota bacterium]